MGGALRERGIWSYSVEMFGGSAQDQGAETAGLEGGDTSLATDPGPGREERGIRGSSRPELHRLGRGRGSLKTRSGEPQQGQGWVGQGFRAVPTWTAECGLSSGWTEVAPRLGSSRLVSL